MMIISVTKNMRHILQIIVYFVFYIDLCLFQLKQHDMTMAMAMAMWYKKKENQIYNTGP